MRNINDIIFAVFNEETLNEEEQKLLKKENSEIYRFYETEIEFVPELLAGLDVTLQNKIKDIKTNSTCKECGEEYRPRYKYLLHNYNDDCGYCNKCLKNFALNYVYLKQMEGNYEELKDNHDKLEGEISYFSRTDFRKMDNIFNKVEKERERIGAILDRCSREYLNNIDEINAYYYRDGDIVHITSDSNKGERVHDICDLRNFDKFKIEYDADCKNIELKFKDYRKRAEFFYIDDKNSYKWIIPRGMELKFGENCGDFYFE